MKKTLLLLLFALGISSLSFGQIHLNIGAVKNIKQETKALLDAASKQIEISDYQKKSVEKLLIKVRQERYRIENSELGASEKTSALEILENQKKNGLKTMLNTQQYEVLLAFMEEEK